MRSDTISMLREFSGEELLWLAIRSNADMRAKVTREIELRARLAGASRKGRPSHSAPSRSNFAIGQAG